MAEVINEHRICVSGLDPDIGLADLKSIFSSYGEVCCVSLDERRRFGFVSYRHKREARYAIEDMNLIWLIGNPSRVEWALGWPREESDESDTEPLAFLRTLPEFQQIRRNPQMLTPVLEQISRNNPQLLMLIAHNPIEFLRMLKEPQEPASSHPVVAGTGASPLESSLREATPQGSPQGRDAIERGLQDLPADSEPQQQGTTPPGDIQSFNSISIPTGNDAEPLAFFRTRPKFQQIRQNPQRPIPVFEQISQNNPRLLLLISQNQEEFVRMLIEPPGPASAQPSVAGTGTNPLESSLAQDRDAIERATSASVTPMQLQSEPVIHDAGLAIASVEESVEPTESLVDLPTQSGYQQILQRVQQMQQKAQHLQQGFRQLHHKVQQIEQMVQHSEHLIQQILPEGQQMRQEIRISQNQEEFVPMLHESQGPASTQPVVAGTGTSPLESSLGTATAQVSSQDRDAIERATASSTSDASRISQFQSEPAILFSGLSIASLPESVEPSGATNAKETEVEEKVEVTKVDKKVEETKTVDFRCKICMDEQIGVVFVPCGHLTSCPRCARRISNCPICRRGITGEVRTYLS